MDKKCLLKINVSEVKPIPENEVEEFKKTYINDDYIENDDDPEAKARCEHSNELMFKRWDWIHEHPETYVNMLRIKGYTDEQIQDCLDGIRPVSYPTKELHVEFKKALIELRPKLEEELNFKDMWFGQTGSSVVGYSSNPCKGFADRPSKITNFKTSDVDIIVVAKGVNNFFNKLKEEGMEMWVMPSVVELDPKFNITRYDPIEVSKISKILVEFKKKFEKKLPAGIQISFQEYGTRFAPWEVPIDLEDLEN